MEATTKHVPGTDAEISELREHKEQMADEIGALLKLVDERTADNERSVEALTAMTADRDRLLNRMASLQRGTLLAQAALKQVRASKEASAQINTEMVDALIRSIDATIQGEPPSPQRPAPRNNA